MVIAQTVLILPIIAALCRQAVEDAWREYEEQLRSLGVEGLPAALTLVWDIRYSLVTAVLAGLGRACAEVGAVMIVGGNIDGVTRVMTTTIALETSKGDLPLALGLGIVLIAIVLALNAAADVVKDSGAAEVRMILPLRLEQASFAAGGREIIPPLSLEIGAGPNTVILGANGAGKSVLMRLMHGLLEPTAGTDRLERRRPAARAPAAGDGVPAPGDAAPVARAPTSSTRCRPRALPRPNASAAPTRRSREVGPVAPRGAAGAGAVRRRAAAARAGARLGAASRSAVPRRAHREPRSERDARDRDRDQGLRCRRAPRSSWPRTTSARRGASATK